MNKIQTVINCVLGAAVVALFLLFFLGKSDKPQAAAPLAVAAGEQLPVAYVNLDSVLLNYTFAIEANDKLMTKQEDARLKLNTKANTLQREAADFQRKLENNAFLSRERAEAEQNKLIRKQQELQELEAKLTNEIMQQNQELNLQLADTLNTFLAEFNADGRYQIIFANTGKDNILQAADAYDVTEEVISQLNARCAKKK
ncbi:MAG: OmpH family outer membrane protein [Paludibacteraceae bacterium]|nr:OmpH family outer membrane protein [Paludibacteraceae bacterium]